MAVYVVSLLRLLKAATHSFLPRCPMGGTPRLVPYRAFEIKVFSFLSWCPMVGALWLVPSFPKSACTERVKLVP